MIPIGVDIGWLLNYPGYKSDGLVKSQRSDDSLAERSQAVKGFRCKTRRRPVFYSFLLVSSSSRLNEFVQLTWSALRGCNAAQRSIWTFYEVVRSDFKNI